MRDVTRLELLAPAKDEECGKAAIDCGADAVYIGAPRFGAREKAGNCVEDIGKLCEYAHRFWARVYVTVNTLLRDDELDDAVALIWEVYRAGADAVIIQDVGLLECELPPLALIASTQMHNHTPERVKFLERVGFTRVILARELTVEEIAAIHTAAPKIELESFIHGALCVCYSGQCYLSYARGGRSGNRGACAQPCRLKYTLEDRDGRVIAGPGHLLSLKDLNVTEHLADLVAAGVTSFKIEGRLKEREYVMNTVAWYRARLDELITRYGYRRASSGRSCPGFEPNVHKTFNRGYTSYFLRGGDAGMNEARSPKWVGEHVGVVRRVNGKKIEIETEVRLANGDGISYFNERNELCGARVNRAEGRRVWLTEVTGLKPGTIVYRNYDHAFMRALERARPERKIGVRFTVEVSGGQAQCGVRDEDGVSVNMPCAWEGKLAADAAQVRERIVRQFEKCGGSGLACEGVTVTLTEPGMPPVAFLNELRRRLCDALLAARVAQRPKMTRRARDMHAEFPERVLDMRGNVLNKKAAAFYRRHGVREIAVAGDARRSLDGEVVMTTKYCPLRQRGLCLHGARGVEIKQPLFLRDEAGTRLELQCDRDACCMRYVLRTSGSSRG